MRPSKLIDQNFVRSSNSGKEAVAGAVYTQQIPEEHRRKRGKDQEKRGLSAFLAGSNRMGGFIKKRENDRKRQGLRRRERRSLEIEDRGEDGVRCESTMSSRTNRRDGD